MTNKKKILLVVGSINQGGAEFQLLSLARLLQSKGLNVEVLALTDYNYFKPYIVEHGIKYSSVSNEGSTLKRLRKAVKQIIGKKPDLVISYIKRVSQVSIVARVLSGFRFKLIISERTSLIKPRHDLFYFNLALLANKVTVNSTSKYAYIKKRFPLLTNRTEFIPNIIDIKKFSSVQLNKYEFENVRISYVGRISPEKNLLNLVKAIHIIVDKGYKVTFSLIGESNNKNYLEEVSNLINKLKLETVVKYEGPTTDVTEVYKKTDLLCLVSVFEGFSNVLSEAIASGIPVIASDIEENRFLVDDKINGFLVDPNDPASLAAGIEKFLQLTPAEVEIISKSNRKKAIAIFDEENLYQRYLGIFKQIDFRAS
jgi:glycosyltransferase involved in cell wall biosynthesis